MKSLVFRSLGTNFWPWANAYVVELLKLKLSKTSQVYYGQIWLLNARAHFVSSATALSHTGAKKVQRP